MAHHPYYTLPAGENQKEKMQEQNSQLLHRTVRGRSLGTLILFAGFVRTDEPITALLP